jgi:hypothetical protein
MEDGKEKKYCKTTNYYPNDNSNTTKTMAE